jgi:hypothetical protein
MGLRWCEFALRRIEGFYYRMQILLLERVRSQLIGPKAGGGNSKP